MTSVDTDPGDSAAFEQLYRLHASRVYRHCARQLGGLEGAEDLTACQTRTYTFDIVRPPNFRSSSLESLGSSERAGVSS
jgi:hypothetical protein